MSLVKDVQHLTTLFDLDMEYQQELQPVTSPEGKVGEYIGSGTGNVVGSKVQGTIQWDLYEIIGETSCHTNFAGVITTDDGVQIAYDARGYGMVRDQSRPHDWYMAYAVKFETSEQRYEWINHIIGLWEGKFDMQSYRHQYRVYANLP